MRRNRPTTETRPLRGSEFGPTLLLRGVALLALLGALGPTAVASDPTPVQAQAPRTSPAPDDLLRSPLDRPTYEAWSWAAWTGEQREPLFALSLQATSDVWDREEVQPPVEGVPPVTDAAEDGQAPPAEGDPVETAPPVAPVVDGPLPADQNNLASDPEAAIDGAVRAEAAAEIVVEASAPSPFADLDLDLYARSVAPVPPGIPDSRVKSRTTARATARAELAAALAGPDGETWSAFLQEQLRYGQDAPTTWRGLADLVVEFELFELAPALATGLESDPAELVFQVSRHTLGELYGRDFNDLADFESFTEGLDLSPATLRLLGELRAARSGSRERLLELLNYDRTAAVEHLADVDPLVRAGAARVLATALAEGEGDGEAGTLLPALLDRLTVERWPNVAAVLLDAAGDALEARPAGDPMIQRLRRGLADATGAQTISAELLVATALARLPWTGDFPAEDSLEYGADLMAKLVERALPDGVDASQDADVALGVLRAVESLMRGAGGDLATSERLSSGELVAPLEKILRDRGAATSVRVVASGILPEVAAADGLVLVNELLAAEDAGLTTELRFALLGAVGRFARRGDAGPEVLGPTVDSLVAEFARPEADLRRMALELLAEESLDPFLVGRDLTPFVARLGEEQDSELKDALFALLGRHGTATTLRRVLSLEGLGELIGRDAAGEASMARLISNLSGGDPLLVLDGAKALWEVAVEEGQVSRRTRALALVAELSGDQVGPLEGSAHYVISHWATTLRAQGVDLATAMPGGVEFLERLVEVHVKRMGSNAEYTPGDQALMTALFLSDVAAAKGNGEAQKLKVRVLENFARAEEGAADHDNPNFRLLVQRSRARFLAGTGDLAALDDFEKLFASNRQGLLETVDLRAAGLLAQNRKDASGDEAAWRYSRALVTHESWKQEPPAVRLEDLRSLATRAQTLAELEVLAEATALFEGLPVEASTAETGSEPRAWSGLVGDAASLGELVRLRNELSEATDAVAASQVPEPTPGVEEPVVDSTGTPPEGNNS